MFDINDLIYFAKTSGLCYSKCDGTLLLKDKKGDDDVMHLYLEYTQIFYTSYFKLGYTSNRFSFQLKIKDYKITSTRLFNNAYECLDSDLKFNDIMEMKTVDGVLEEFFPLEETETKEPGE